VCWLLSLVLVIFGLLLLFVQLYRNPLTGYAENQVAGGTGGTRSLFPIELVEEDFVWQGALHSARGC